MRQLGFAGVTMLFSEFHSQFQAHRLSLQGTSEGNFAKSLASARVQMNPHQVDAALFALSPPLQRGAMLADEVGLGKTIEASLVIAQRWAEKRRNILLIVPASLRKQWAQELHEKFALPSLILDAKSYRERKMGGVKRPFQADNQIVIVSYDFAARRSEDVALIEWDLVVLDEAHRLRNVYQKEGAKRAKALREALNKRFKILLTATPLQNSLMELFGLVSIIDPHVFGDANSFRLNFVVNGSGPDELAILRDRLKPVCLRTLRADVQAAGHINFTRRIPHTFSFEPHDDEQRLYEDLSAFLQRPDSIAFGGKPNQLITLVVRKILGSSTFAVAKTLTRIIERLEALQPLESQDLEDLDTADELAEEWTGDADGEEGGDAEDEIDPVQLAEEIEELKGYRDLALSIKANAKGAALISKLGGVLDEIENKRGLRKAVIFTESVRTQKYLCSLLEANGYAGQIVLMNGSNSDPASQKIYQSWRKRHEGTASISGSKSADMKAAIVEAFRNEKTILIATESGAEGINLQFCSLLINFDLPWNPQRVEQRIGRCHRYGQKIDVLVINFLNTKNRAEQRILQLLTEKFHLFSGVFGASDEVLGVIENGTDFVKRVFEILQQARDDAAIDAAFNKLQEELDPQIRADMVEARNKLIGHFDQDVVRHLRAQKDALNRVLDDFERRLHIIMQAEIPDARYFAGPDGSPCFEHEGSTYTSNWELAETNGWEFLSLGDDHLAQGLVERAMARSLPEKVVRFSYSAHPLEGQLSDIKVLIGSSGWLHVERLGMRTKKRLTEDLIVSAILDDGTPLDSKAAERLFLLAGSIEGNPTAPAPLGKLKARSGELVSSRVDSEQQRNAEHLLKEQEKLDAYAEDLEKAAEIEIKHLEDEIKAMRRQSRTISALQEKLKIQREIKRKEGQRDKLRMSMFARRDEIRKEVDEHLDEIEASLALVPEITPIMTIRWELVA